MIVLLATLATVLVAGAIVLAGKIARTRSYYILMFSTDHFREFHESMSRAIMAVCDQETSPDALHEELTIETARKSTQNFVTAAGLATCVSCGFSEDGARSIHVSFSQPERITTHSVCSRFGFFVISMIFERDISVNPYYTQTGVHHLICNLSSKNPSVRSFEATYAYYQQHYDPVPFRLEETDLSAVTRARAQK